MDELAPWTTTGGFIKSEDIKSYFLNNIDREMARIKPTDARTSWEEMKVPYQSFRYRYNYPHITLDELLTRY